MNTASRSFTVDTVLAVEMVRSGPAKVSQPPPLTPPPPPRGRRLGRRLVQGLCRGRRRLSCRRLPCRRALASASFFSCSASASAASRAARYCSAANARRRHHRLLCQLLQLAVDRGWSSKAAHRPAHRLQPRGLPNSSASRMPTQADAASGGRTRRSCGSAA